MLTYFDNMPGVRKTLGSLMMLSASLETCFAILFFWVDEARLPRPLLKAVDDDGFSELEWP